MFYSRVPKIVNSYPESIEKASRCFKCRWIRGLASDAFIHIKNIGCVSLFQPSALWRAETCVFRDCERIASRQVVTSFMARRTSLVFQHFFIVMLQERDRHELTAKILTMLTFSGIIYAWRDRIVWNLVHSIYMVLLQIFPRPPFTPFCLKCQ